MLSLCPCVCLSVSVCLVWLCYIGCLHLTRVSTCCYCRTTALRTSCVNVCSRPSPTAKDLACSESSTHNYSTFFLAQTPFPFLLSSTSVSSFFFSLFLVLSSSLIDPCQQNKALWHWKFLKNFFPFLKTCKVFESYIGSRRF